MNIGRKPVKMLAAGKWIALHRPELVIAAPSYVQNRRHWRLVADLVRAEGFFSQTTSTVDVPVYRIMEEAARLARVWTGDAP